MRQVTIETARDDAPEWAKNWQPWRWYEPKDGDVIDRTYPFTRMRSEDVQYFDLQEVRSEHEWWRPGAWFHTAAGYDCAPACHEEGRLILRVVHVAKLPKPYPRRVLYTRQFVTPGNPQREYKKSGLKWATVNKFRKLCHHSPVPGYHVCPHRAAVEA